MDLPKILPFLGKTQLQVLSAVATFLLVGTHLIMAFMVKEKVLLANTDAAGYVGRSTPFQDPLTLSCYRRKNKKSFKQELKDIWTNILTLPRTIRQIVSRTSLRP